MRTFFTVRPTMRRNYIEQETEVEGVTVRELPPITLPTRSDSGSAGYDFYAVKDICIQPQEMQMVWTDVKACMLPDEYLALHLRSSIGVKYGLMLANGTGIIDSSYFCNKDNDGNIGIPLYNTSNEVVHIPAGDRIAQGIFQKFLTTIDDTVIGNTRNGGFGSSGK